MHFWKFWNNNRFALTSLILLFCCVLTTFVMLPIIFSHHTPFFITTMAICASLSIAVIFYTCGKMYIDSLEMDEECQISSIMQTTPSLTAYRNPVFQQELGMDPESQIDNIAVGGPRHSSRPQLLRIPSLPTYENVVSAQGCESEETPPPSYHEICFPKWI